MVLLYFHFKKIFSYLRQICKQHMDFKFNIFILNLLLGIILLIQKN